MKARLNIFILSLVALASVAMISPAFAEDNSDALPKEQSGAISQSCDSIKQSLKKLQKSDTKTRSYLGSLYEVFLTDFISPLNLRLVKNDLPSTTLTELHSSIISKRQDFAKKFTIYSQDFEALLDKDCHSDPTGFYKQLQVTRKSRAALEQSTEAIRMLLEKHQNAVQSLKGSL